MALSFTRLSWLWLRGNEKEQVSNGSIVNSINSLADWGRGIRGELEHSKFYSIKGVERRMPSSPGMVKRKWKSREERGRCVDKEYDVVLLPSDGVCLSGSESDGSDWSIGWLEPHPPDFQSDDDMDGCFPGLVPCHRHAFREIKEEDEETTANPFLKNFPVGYSTGEGILDEFDMP